MQINPDGTSCYLPPRQDINAPDLYIPLMAIFTYIVVVGFSAGSKGHFSPQLISSSLSACFVAIILEVLDFILYSFLALGSSSYSLLDQLSCFTH